jgi:Methyltransferase domain
LELVLKKHIELHLKKLKPIPAGDFNLLDFTCQAIDLSYKSCFRLEYLYALCWRVRPSKVVETGVHHGVSTAFILQALKETDGHLYSIDLPNAEYDTDRSLHQADTLLGSHTAFLVPDELRAKWTLELGDSRNVLPPLLRSIGPIEIFHHDSIHTYEGMKFEYETAWPYLTDNGLLLSDDVEWSEAFRDFCLRQHADYRIHRGIGIALKSVPLDTSA